MATNQLPRKERHDIYREELLRNLEIIPFNKLEKESFIDAGTFGQVHKVKYQGRNGYEILAFKDLSNKNTNTRQKLRNEAASQAKLNHPNIVQLYAIVDDEDKFGLVMEYLKNGDMIKYAAQPDFSPNDTIWLIHDVSEGMKYLHQQYKPIIHGDLKRSNVLISDDGHAKITDFGMSSWKDYSKPGSVSNVLSGTLTHVPPEYFEQRTLFKEEKYDVYSFAIFMWESITKKFAFEHGLDMTIPVWVRNGERPPIEEYPEEYSSTLKDLTNECWKQNPKERPFFPYICEKLSEIINQVQGGILGDRDMVDEGQRVVAATSTNSRPTVPDAVMVSLRPTVSNVVRTRARPTLSDVEMTSQSETTLDIENALKNFSLRTEKSKLALRPYDATFGNSQFLMANHADWGPTSYKPALFTEHVGRNTSLNYLWSEINIHLKLSYVTILQFIRVVFEPGHIGLLFEHIRFGTLKHFKQSNAKIPSREKLKMLWDVSRGLSYLHSLKPPIIHCCVKTEHAYVVDKLQVKLSDFQFAQEKIEGAKLEIERFKVNGKPSTYHIPQEYYRDEILHLAEEIDVYAFAWVIAEVLNPDDFFKTALVGFPTRNIAEIVQFGYRPPCEFPDDVPQEIAIAVDACFTEDKDWWPSIGNTMEWLRGKKL